MIEAIPNRFADRARAVAQLGFSPSVSLGAMNPPVVSPAPP